MVNKQSPDPRRALAEAFSRMVPNLVRGAHLDFFAKRRVTPGQMFVMLAMESTGNADMSGLARGMHVRLPTMTGLVDRLVAQDYVRRRAHAQDRRRVLVALTAKGREFVDTYRAMIAHRFAEVITPLNDHDVQAMRTAIEKILASFAGGPKP